MGGPDDVAAVTYDVVDPQSPDADWAMGRYFAELDERFPGGFDPGDAGDDDRTSMRQPEGVFVVLHAEGAAIGCGGVQRIDESTVEIKRMWVHDDWRGLGLGRSLLAHLEDRCRELGARTVVLDTNGTLTGAIAMYERSGYLAIERYNDNPYAEHWFQKDLESVPEG